MPKRKIIFTEEQRKILRINPNIEDVTEFTIKFTAEFKQKALELSLEGFTPNQIFKNADIDLNIVGRNLAGNCLGNWKHAKKIKTKNSTKYLAKETKKNKALQAIIDENKYLKAENEFLKKLQALSEIAEQE